MKVIPQIGDIWLDNDGDYSMVTGFRESYKDNETFVELFVLNQKEDSGRETYMEDGAFGEKQYMHTLVSRIKRDEGNK